VLKFKKLSYTIQIWRMVIFTADGYCRSEAIVAIYLQKKESAKRIYATVVHSKNNADGYKDKGSVIYFSR